MRLPTPREALAVLGATAMLGAGSFAATVALVAAAPSAGATTVSTEQEFRDAWANDADITLANDITLTCDGGGRAVRTIGDDFVLDGQGHTITQTCAGNGVLKVDDFDSGPSAQVRNITITGGAEREGGEHGGGLYFDSDGSLTVGNSAFLNNSTCADGGGLDYEGDDLVIAHSTLAANTATGVGGALWASGESVVIIDSTVSGNQAERDAGALQTAGTALQLGYVTLVQNSIAAGPACDEEIPNGVASGGHVNSQGEGNPAQVNIEDGSLTSFGSVLALPSAGEANCFLEAPATTSQGYNFSDDASCGFTGTGDRETAGDPGLGALGYNGGLAPTQVPQTGSPLIDAIPVAACQTGVATGVADDERGIARPEGSGCDIGAVEVEVIAAAPLVIAPRFTG
jgi:hypothetical protein